MKKKKLKKRDFKGKLKLNINPKKMCKSIEFTLDTKKYLALFDLVESHFKDSVKTMKWFSAKNPLLGYISPNQMIEIGRYDFLKRFIVECLDQNKKPL